MTGAVKIGGAIKPLSIISGHAGGSIRRLNRGWEKAAGVWRQTWQDEVVATLGSTSTVVLKNLFTAAEWANPLILKRVVVAPGAHVGTSTHEYAVVVQPYVDGAGGSWAGDLILDNHGTISGLGGVANSGKGGDVILSNFPSRTGQKLIVNNYGTVRAGGGGGGRGGNGGPGVWYSGRTATEGPIAREWDYGWWGADYVYRWAGVSTPYDTGSPFSHLNADGWTYSRGALWGYTNIYYVIRQKWVLDVPNYTAGGIGGNGGRGQGYDGLNTAGTPGSAGGTNAGAGGYGSWGHEYGNSGNAGAPGGAGNAGAGLAGAAGGLPGFYLNGAANAILNNFGTLQGRIQ